MFPDIAYLEWIEGRPEAVEHDLGSSDLRRTPATPIPPALADVEAPAAGLKTQLAEAYGVGSENVLLTAGATHANFLAVAATVSEAETKRDDDATVRVLVEKPGYEPLRASPRAVGARVDRFRRPNEADYALDPERVDAALVEDTAMVTVTNRHNPSGRRAGRDTLAETARVVSDGGARLLVDEVYAPFSAGPETGDGTGPFDGPTAGGLPNTVVTNSLTKFCGFGEVRLGWLVADEAFVDRARSVRHHVPAVADPSELLAGRALARADELGVESRERIRTNRELLASFVAERDDLTGRVEPGCTYAFLEHDHADGTEVAETAWDHDVLVVPGRFFDDPDRFRVAACLDPATVRAGLDAFGDVLDSLGS